MLIESKFGRCQSRGITLVELMIVVAIFAILLGLAAPSFQTFIQNAKIRTAAEGVQTGLVLARSEALRRNASVSFWLVTDVTAACALSGNGNSWVVSFDNPAGHCTDAPSDSDNPRIIQAGEPASGSNGVSVTALSGGGASTNCITFNGLGRAEAKCIGTALDRVGQIEFTSSSSAVTRIFRVSIDSGGGARLCDPSKVGIAGC